MNLDDLIKAVNERRAANKLAPLDGPAMVDFMYRATLQMDVIKAEAQITAARKAAQTQATQAEADAQAKQAANDALRALIAAE